MHPRTIIVSDLHLGAGPPESEARFLEFLEGFDELGDELLINGDLFDFWFEYGQVALRGHLDVLAALRRLVLAGVRIRFLGGNHDAWGGSFLEDEVGLEILDGPVELTIGGHRAYVAHGDGLGGGDWGYRALKAATRSRLGRAVFRWIHPDLGVPLARRASSTETKRADGPGVGSARDRRLAGLAHAILEDRAELDLVIFGHTHVPRLDRVGPGRFYLNAGDWIHHHSYGIVSRDGVRLVPDPAEGSASIATRSR